MVYERGGLAAPSDLEGSRRHPLGFKLRSAIMSGFRIRAIACLAFAQS